MKPISISDILRATGGTLLCGRESDSVSTVCTDTRALSQGGLFVPLIGERFDAHDFIEASFAGGCTAALTAREDIKKEKNLILVADTRRALGDLAAFYRQQFNIPVVAVTGSVGKTTVKELTAAVFSSRLNVLKTAGNFNNEIGLPLTLFRLDDSHQIAITEMGMSGFGEIDTLASIATPDIGLVTNIGVSHIEKLGSQENIYKAKSELFRHIKPGGTVILNYDDPILRAHRDEIPCKTVTVGLSPDCDVTATNIISRADSVSFTIICGNETAPVTLAFPGEHNVTNALLACAAGLCVNISLTDSAKALETYVPADRRMQLMDCAGVTVINDCYNAAPDSMRAALKVLCAQNGRKIAVLGDIKELGEHTLSAHTAIGQFAAESQIDALFTLGEYGKMIAKGALSGGMNVDSVYAFDDISALCSTLTNFLKQGDTVLVKASRAMQLERVTAHLSQRA